MSVVEPPVFAIAVCFHADERIVCLKSVREKPQIGVNGKLLGDEEHPLSSEIAFVRELPDQRFTHLRVVSEQVGAPPTRRTFGSAHRSSRAELLWAVLRKRFIPQQIKKVLLFRDGKLILTVSHGLQ